MTHSSSTASSPGFIVRVGHLTKHLPHDSALHEDSVYLVDIQSLSGHSCIVPMCPSPERAPCEKPWLVIKSIQHAGEITGYQICEGDVLKFGRLKFRVKELNADERTIERFDFNEMLEVSEESEESEEEGGCEPSEFSCRICLEGDLGAENPLISPCICGGTMKYIHIRCLQRCLKSKLTTRASEHTLSLAWKTLGCDLCKKAFPYRISMGENVIELVEIPKPPARYIILEALRREQGGYRGIHVISLYSKDSARFGRSMECELKVSDISVSRSHAVFKLVNGKFYVEDTKSKFGSLVQIKRPIPLEFYPTLSVQVGRSLLNIKTKQPWSFIPMCFRSTSSLCENPTVLAGSSLFPINTGIPLSISDSEELLARAGLRPIHRHKYRQNTNLLFEHQQLGMNSSIEFDEQEIDIEEVEVAENNPGGIDRVPRETVHEENEVFIEETHDSNFNLD